jgi:hypothetical protein
VITLEVVFSQKCEYNKIPHSCVILSNVVFYKFLTSVHHSTSEEPISAVGDPIKKQQCCHWWWDVRRIISGRGDLNYNMGLL